MSVKDLVPISGRQKDTIQRILDWENRIAIDGLIDKGRSASTISRWAREQGFKVGLETMERYIELYEKAKVKSCRITELPEIVGPTNLPDLFTDLEGIHEASPMQDDILKLDMISDKGLDIVLNTEMITARDVIQAIKTKREIIAERSEALLEKLTIMDDRIRKLFDIIVEEVPEEYHGRILARFREEFGDN